MGAARNPATGNQDRAQKPARSAGRRKKSVMPWSVRATSQIAVLPAFAHAAKNSELAALISDDPLKLKKLSKTYGVGQLAAYDEYDALMAARSMRFTLHCRTTCILNIRCVRRVPVSMCCAKSRWRPPSRNASR